MAKPWYKNPMLPNIEAIIAAGINPKTGLPIKMGGKKCTLKQDIAKQLRINDQQSFVMRFTWHGLPRGLDSQDLERMLYYKGQICIFWNKTLNKFFAMPFAPIGPFDYMGRPTLVKPVPFGVPNAQGDKAKATPLEEWLSTLTLRVLWDMPLIEELVVDPAMLEECCVIIQDYTPQISQTVLSRQVINDPIIDLEAEMFPFLRTALLNSTGIKGMRVDNEDESYEVLEASRSIEDAALNGETFVPMVGNSDFQEFTNGTTISPQEFLMTMQSLDNFRMNSLGLEQGGIFEKSERKLVAEAEMSTSNAALTLNDCLLQRQKRADIMTALWGQPVSVTISEPTQSTDYDMDGQMASETDQHNSQQEAAQDDSMQ